VHKPPRDRATADVPTARRGLKSGLMTHLCHKPGGGGDRDSAVQQPITPTGSQPCYSRLHRVPWRPSRPLGASREAALSSCRIYSRSRIACRSYWRRPETMYRRSLGHLPLPETLAPSPRMHSPCRACALSRTAPPDLPAPPLPVQGPGRVGPPRGKDSQALAVLAYLDSAPWQREGQR
jgi:hypothetical protein